MVDIRDCYINLFKNKFKDTDSKPDMIGKITNKAKEDVYQIAAWKKKDKNGNTYLSISVSDLYKNDDNKSTSSSQEDDWDFD